MRVLIVVGALLVVAVALVVYFAVSGSGSKAGAAGCIDVTIASTTGAAKAHACGSAARRLCRTERGGSTPFATELRTQCRRAGYPISGAAGGR
jgi:hypothetical protein